MRREDQRMEKKLIEINGNPIWNEAVLQQLCKTSADSRSLYTLLLSSKVDSQTCRKLGLAQAVRQTM